MFISLTTAFTLIGSFGGATAAQIISHILTQKREDKKFKKEALQNLYSPIIFKIKDFIESIDMSPFGYIRKINDTEKLFNEIMDEMGKNLKYAEPDIINFFQEVRDDFESDKSKIENSISFIDEKYEEVVSDQRMLHRFQLLNAFINEYFKINKVLSSDKNPITEKLRIPFFFTHFYLLVKECSSFIDPITSDEILEMYDLVSFALQPQNNFLESITEIRRELNIVIYTNAYKDNRRVSDAYANAFEFLYTLADEFSIASQERSDDWKELLKTNLSHQ